MKKNTSQAAEALVTYFWFRRLTLASAAALVTLAIAWPIVQQVAERRLNAAISQLQAAGVAMKITDLQPPAVEDRDNAAWYYKQAFAAISKAFDPPRASNYDYQQLGTAPKFTAFWQELVDRSEVDNAQAFALARQARGHDRVDWGWTFKSPAFSILLPSLNDSRNLANLLGDGAERSFFMGDSAEGIERIRDIFLLARRTSVASFLVTALVANGIDALLVEALAPHVGTLRIGDGPGLVSRHAVRELQSALLDDDEAKRLKEAMRVETTALLDQAQAVVDHSHVARPAVTADVARVCERQLELIAAADAPTNVERNRRLDAATPAAAYPYGVAIGFMTATKPLSPTGFYVGRPLSHTLGTGNYDRAFTTFARSATARDAVAIALGLRLYELDHGGAWPASLEAMVPEYLPSIPRNKSSADDAPYLYQLVPHGLPDGRDRPILVKDGQRISRETIKVARDYTSGPIIELSSLAEPEPPASMPTTIPAVPRATMP